MRSQTPRASDQIQTSQTSPLPTHLAKPWRAIFLTVAFVSPILSLNYAFTGDAMFSIGAGERSDSSILSTTITNNLLLVASLIANDAALTICTSFGAMILYLFGSLDQQVTSADGGVVVALARKRDKRSLVTFALWMTCFELGLTLGEVRMDEERRKAEAERQQQTTNRE